MVRGAGSLGSLVGAILAAAVLAGGAGGVRPPSALHALPAEAASLLGAHDPAWAPGGAVVALTLRDQIWVLGVDGRDARTLVRWPSGKEVVERDPSWSPDGRWIAFAARLDEQGFDLYLVEARGGAPRRLTATAGDERWPSWTPDGRLVFAARPAGQWDLVATTAPVGRAAKTSRPSGVHDGQRSSPAVAVSRRGAPPRASTR